MKEEYILLSFKKKDLSYTRGLSENDTIDKPDLKNHYSNPKNIPARESKYKMTLVFDLDQTLVSADGIGDECERDPTTKLVIRPHAYEVLKILRRNKDVEFIIWTAAMDGHAKRVVYSFPDIHFDYIISRFNTKQSSWFNPSNMRKNLNLLTSESRPLDSIILIDDRMDIGKEHPENLLIVPAYNPKEIHGITDTTLLYLANILQRSINKYRSNQSSPIYTYLYSPLSEKCIYDKSFYYGVKCFKDEDEFNKRLKLFI